MRHRPPLARVLRRAGATATLLSIVLWTGVAGAQNPGIASEKAIAQLSAANQALADRVKSLTEQNARLGVTIDQLQSQLNAAKAASGGKQGPALAALATLAAVQQDLVAARNEIATLQRDNGDLKNTVATLQQNVDGGQAIQQAQTLRQEVSNANAQISQLKDEVSTLIRTGKTADATQAQLQRQQAQIDTLASSNDRLSRTRLLWAASAALLAAGVSAAGVRRWWPRRTQVARPLSVSARLGDWTLSARPGLVSPAFGVTARWLPGERLVSAVGPLVVHPRAASVQGEAA